MNTATPTAPVTVPHLDHLDHADRPQSGPDRAVRYAGFAGLTWFTLLVITNIFNGSAAPAAGADIETVRAHLVDDRPIIIAVTAAFVAGVPLVFWFASGLAGVLRRAGLGQAADAGILGVAGIYTMFGLAAITRLALMTAVETDAVDDSAIWTMWKLHDIAFSVNGIAIAAAILAFGLGGVVAGLLPRWIKPVAIVGATSLVASSVFFAVPVAEGSNPAMLPGLVGFIMWLTVVLTASLRLIRLGSAPAPR